MPHFVIGYDTPFLTGQDTVFLLLTHAHQFHGIQQILLAHIFPAVLDGQDRCFIDHIGQIRTHGTDRSQTDLVQINGLIHQHILGMHFQDLHTSFQIRLFHDDTAVKTSRSQKCLIQYFRPVGRCQQDDPALGIKAVHLGKQLVQCLLTLIITAAVFGITAASDGIDLVDKDDTRCTLFCFLKQVTHTGCTHTDIQFNKVGARQREERHARFPGYCFCQQCLTGSRRAYEQGTLRDLRTDLGVFRRIVQEVYDLDQRLLRFILTGHVLKGDAGLFAFIHLRRGTSHTETETAAALHPAEQKSHQHPQQHDWQHIGQHQIQDQAAAVLHLGLHLHVGLDHTVCDRFHFLRQPGEIAVVGACGCRTVTAFRFDQDAVRLDLHALNLAALHHRQELIIAELFRRSRRAVHKPADEQKRQHGHNNKRQDIGAAAGAVPVVIPVITVVVSFVQIVFFVSSALRIVIVFGHLNTSFPNIICDTVSSSGNAAHWSGSHPVSGRYSYLPARG